MNPQLVQRKVTTDVDRTAMPTSVASQDGTGQCSGTSTGGGAERSGTMVDMPLFTRGLLGSAHSVAESEFRRNRDDP